ncbi:MAG: CCA tRNA nucleotidyltransferase [Candidatus Sumerlaeales bacterium]|nr:CCA tRNA nucleotidyltransferase [Candidatus Sumerlaeales bacterium]
MTKPKTQSAPPTMRNTDTNDALANAMSIINSLRQHGHETFLVGGCVRDRLLNRPPKDYDVTTQATPRQIKALFPKAKLIGASFAVMEYQQIQIASFRKDGKYSDKRHPDNIDFGTIEEDAARRDFTINALYELPNPRNLARPGSITDFFGGREDLRNRVLRTVGNPNARFREDALRLMRAVRFAARFNMTIAPQTLRAMTRHHRELSMISRERVRDEFLLIITGAQPTHALDIIIKTKLLAPICDNRTLDYLVRKNCARLTPLSKLLSPTTSTNNHQCLMIAALLADADKKRRTPQAAVEALQKLRLANKQTKLITEILQCLDQLRLPDHKTIAQHSARVIAAHPAAPLILALARIIFKTKPNIKRNINAINKWINTNQTRLPDPLITGNTLIRMGIKPATSYATILSKIYNLQLDGKINTADEARKTIAKIIVAQQKRNR